MSQNSLNPLPVAKQIKRPDKYTTKFATLRGELIDLPTEDQAKQKVAAFLKRFKPENWWAQKVSRFRQGNDDHLIAYIVRDFSKIHDRSDMAKISADQMWFGREEIGIPAMTTDEDNHSETHGERIPMTMSMSLPDGTIAELPVLDKRGFYNYTKVNKNTIELYQTMCGMTMDDLETEYIYVLAKGGRTISADDPDDIWDISCETAKLDDRMIKKERRRKELANAKHPEATEKLTG